MDALAPLLPPNELRMIESSGPNMDLDLPVVMAASAELAPAEGALAESALVGSLAASTAAAAVDELSALADVPDLGLAAAYSLSSVMAAEGVQYAAASLGAGHGLALSAVDGSLTGAAAAEKGTHIPKTADSGLNIIEQPPEDGSYGQPTNESATVPSQQEPAATGTKAWQAPNDRQVDAELSDEDIDCQMGGHQQEHSAPRRSRLAIVSTAEPSSGPPEGISVSPRVVNPCALDKETPDSSGAVQTAHLSSTEEQPSRHNACSTPAEDPAHAPVNTGLGNSASNAQEMLNCSTGPTHGLSEPALQDELAAAEPGSEVAVLLGRIKNLSAEHTDAGTAWESSQASAHSALLFPNDSETPGSALATAATCAAAAGWGEAPIPAQHQAGNCLHTAQPEQALQEPALAEARGGALQSHNDDAAALELARNARSIASKAAAAPLSVDHPLVRQAALELSRRAAIEKATLQVRSTFCMCTSPKEADIVVCIEACLLLMDLLLCMHFEQGSAPYRSNGN